MFWSLTNRHAFAGRIAEVASFEGADRPSSRLVDQRVRNRIIDYLEVVASYEEQRRYQAAVPMVSVLHELIGLWEDWLQGDPRTTELPAIYSEAEVLAVRRFHTVWEQVAAGTPHRLPPLHAGQLLSGWGELRKAARAALAVFQLRGRVSEDEEI